MLSSRLRACAAPLVLLFALACGGGSDPVTGTAPGTPSWGEATGPSYAVIAVPTPGLVLVGDPALRAVWHLPPDRTFEWVARPLPASRIALPVPPLDAGRYSVEVHQGTRLVARGDVACTGPETVADPAGEVLGWLSVLDSTIDTLRARVLAGELPADLQDFLDIAALQASDTRTLVSTLPAAEVAALGGALGANPSLRGLLGGGVPFVGGGAGCPGAGNLAYSTLETAPARWAEILTGASLGVDVLGSTGTSGVGGLLGGALGLVCILDVHGRAHGLFAYPFVEVPSAHTTCDSDPVVRPSEPFAVTLVGEGRGPEAADRGGAEPLLSAAAGDLDSAFDYVRNTTGWVVAALDIAPASVPQQLDLPAAAPVEVARLDAAHVTWIEAVGSTSGALPETSAIQPDGRLSLTLGGGIPGERVQITYGYHHAGVGPETMQGFTVGIAE